MTRQPPLPSSADLEHVVADQRLQRDVRPHPDQRGGQEIPIHAVQIGAIVWAVRRPSGVRGGQADRPGRPSPTRADSPRGRVTESLVGPRTVGVVPHLG